MKWTAIHPLSGLSESDAPTARRSKVEPIRRMRARIERSSWMSGTSLRLCCPIGAGWWAAGRARWPMSRDGSHLPVCAPGCHPADTGATQPAARQRSGITCLPDDPAVARSSDQEGVPFSGRPVSTGTRSQVAVKILLGDLDAGGHTHSSVSLFRAAACCPWNSIRNEAGNVDSCVDRRQSGCTRFCMHGRLRRPAVRARAGRARSR